MTQCDINFVAEDDGGIPSIELRHLPTHHNKIPKSVFDTVEDVISCFCASIHTSGSLHVSCEFHLAICDGVKVEWTIE